MRLISPAVPLMIYNDETNSKNNNEINDNNGSARKKNNKKNGTRINTELRQLLPP